MREIVALITAVVALTTAAFTFFHTKEQLTRQEEELKSLRSLAERLALEITIDQPREGELLPQGVYKDMRGSFCGNIPIGHDLWVLLSDGKRFYLQAPNAGIEHGTRRWWHSNVRLTAPGQWMLVLCIANKQASDTLKSQIGREQFGGFEFLPAGSEIVKTIKVTVGSQ